MLIDSNNFNDAIRLFFSLFLNIDKFAEKIYSFIPDFIPRFDQDNLEKFIGHLQNLLDVSSHLPQEQYDLARLIALRKAEQASIEDPLPDYHLAMEYLSKAIKIAEASKNVRAHPSDAHFFASKLFIQVIDSKIFETRLEIVNYSKIKLGIRRVEGVPRSDQEAAKWFRLAENTNDESDSN